MCSVLPTFFPIALSASSALRMASLAPVVSARHRASTAKLISEASSKKTVRATWVYSPLVGCWRCLGRDLAVPLKLDVDEPEKVGIKRARHCRTDGVSRFLLYCV